MHVIKIKKEKNLIISNKNNNKNNDISYQITPISPNSNTKNLKAGLISQKNPTLIYSNQAKKTTAIKGNDEELTSHYVNNNQFSYMKMKSN